VKEGGHTVEAPAAGGFADVDRTADPASYVEYLDTASATDAVRAYKRQTFALLDAREGGHLLDAGCGTGDDARALARLVGPGGSVLGVDTSEAMIAEARKRTAGHTLPVRFRQGDICRLGLPDESFDGCRADRVLQHLEDPRAALAELVRLARPGARVVVSEPDWETLVVDAPDQAFTRVVLNARADWPRHGWIGRRLFGLCKDAGLGDVAVVLAPLVVTDYALADRLFDLRGSAARAQTTGAAAADWLDRLEQASGAQRFFSAVTIFVSSGRKP
jgi:SAM-dependent methyltransferase